MASVPGSSGITRRAVLDYSKLSYMIILGAIVYNEYLAYYSAHTRWPNLPQIPNDKQDDVLRILFVADPQIQGNLHEGSWGWIRRWDSDRYLAKTYSWAYSAYSPNLVVFMGDLLDEGSEADDVDFAEYVWRFRNIYNLRDSVYCSEPPPSTEMPQPGGNGACQAIFLPGDNDIGGEGVDPVTPFKANRFNTNFPSKPLYHFQSTNLTLDIIPVSAILESLKKPQMGKGAFSYKDVVKEQKRPNDVRLVLSHFPIILMNPYGDASLLRFADNVRAHLQPSMVFSAHVHHGMDYAESPEILEDDDEGHQKGLPPRHKVNMTNFSLQKNQKDKASLKQQSEFQSYILHQSAESDVLHEINVPTASYRMGMREMALGLAVIDMTQSPQSPPLILWYANLWLPSRFALLFVYVAALVSALVLFIVGRVQTFRRRGRRSSENLGSWKRRSSSSSSSPSPRGRRFRGGGNRSRSGSRDSLHYSKLV